MSKGTEDFKKLNIEKTINDYLKANNITISEMSEIEDVKFDYSSLPFKATVTYTLKGIVNKTEFEEEITQDIYASPEDQDVLEKDYTSANFRIDAIITQR